MSFYHQNQRFQDESSTSRNSVHQSQNHPRNVVPHLPHPVHQFHNMPRNNVEQDFSNVPVSRTEFQEEYFVYDVTRNGVPQTFDLLNVPRLVPHPVEQPVAHPHSGCLVHNVPLGVHPRDRAPLVECSSSPDPTRFSGGNFIGDNGIKLLSRGKWPYLEEISLCSSLLIKGKTAWDQKESNIFQKQTGAE